MADAASSHNTLQLKFHHDHLRTDRGSNYWDPAIVVMKSKLETTWIEAVNAAEGKPDLSMRGKLDEDVEDLGYKLTLIGPLVDYFLRVVSKGIKQRLRKSRATGLMNPFTCNIPFDLMKYICVMWRNYEGKLTTTGNVMQFTAKSKATVEKLFCPARFDGSPTLWKRHYNVLRTRTYTGKRKVSRVLAGKSVVVVSELTPFTMIYNIKSGNLKVSFYRQNYNADGLAEDMTLQRLLNN